MDNGMARERAVESIWHWSIGSLMASWLLLMAVSSLVPWSWIIGWAGSQTLIAVLASGAWVWARRSESATPLLLARALLVLAALAWSVAGFLFVASPDGYIWPTLMALLGVGTASVWWLRDEGRLALAVPVLVLAPMLFHLLAGEGSDWSVAGLALLLIAGSALVRGELAAAGTTQQSGRPSPAAGSQSRESQPAVAPPRSDDTEIVRLRTELERHRNLEKEMEAAKQAAEAANMAKGEFLATMSHEMRTPLNGIIPLLEILRDTKLEPDQRDYVNTSYQSARHLLRIMDDILDYSKIEANKLDLESVGLNLKEVVDSVVRLMDRPAENKGIKLSVSFDPNVRLACRGDPVRLRQVLSNLVSNAIKFTEKGSVSIQISKRSETRTHSELLFAVRDTGMGIAPDKAEKLFQPFSQADTSTTRNFGGTGLGLVICKRIVELMSGKIGLKSEVGRGSVFWFSVPLLKAIGDVGSHRRDLGGSRALLVGTDNRLIQRLTGYCQSWGMTQIATNTTADAISKLKSSATLGDNWAFDVVLVDLGTMRATAPALARNVGREPVLERLRMVFIEGDEPTPPDLAETPKLSLIKRAFSEGELMSTLNKLLEVEGPGERQFNLLAEAAKLGAGTPSRVTASDAAADPAAQVPEMVAAKLAGHALLVEDNPVNRQVAQRLLSLIGITFDVAENGKDAFDMMGKSGFDVVLMDCQMPIMDGYTSTRSRRTLEQERGLPRLPIIAMTANAMAGDREKCLASGMDDYMSKPLNRGLLEQTIRKWMPKNKRAEAPVAPVAATAATAAPARLTEPVRLTSSQPAINEGIVNELIDVMGGEFTSLVKVYLEDTPKNLGILLAAAERGDVQAMIAPAHSLKSTSANLGAMALSDLAKLIEHGARSGTLRDALGMARQAGVEFRRASDELQKLLVTAGG